MTGNDCRDIWLQRGAGTLKPYQGGEGLDAAIPCGGTTWTFDLVLKSPGARTGGTSKLRGRKLDMRCRYPGCKNRSKGPRFRFLCEEHLKLPKAEQNAALAKWTARNA